MNKRTVLALLPLMILSCSGLDRVRSIPVDTYQDKVAGFWLGQLVGNIYGLSHEFKYLEEPGPDTFPYGYGEALERAIELDGAFSDDDTDLEYMYLLQMEEHGIDPTYRKLREAWMYHIRDRIWAANRVALTLMHHGYYPPETGSREHNPRWFEIDPQLVNEIWAITAPGMVSYAVEKTAWAARITNDDFGTEPALFYAAMLSEAFFTDDISALIEVGFEALPSDGRFRGVIREMQALHATYPDNWIQARQVLAEKYYVRQPYNEYGWEPIDAVLNGAAAVLALLYGEGDIQRTLDLACAMGFDADNQAATLTGLLGLAQGSEAIPDDLLRPVAKWTMPFNDRYINVSRHDLPDASITDQIRRLSDQGIRVVEQSGGIRTSMDGVDVLIVDESSHFHAPQELLPLPVQFLTVGDTFDVALYNTAGEVHVVGTMPDWLERNGSRLSGRAMQQGSFRVSLTAGLDSASVRFEVWGPNKASDAVGILHNTMSADLERLRDGSQSLPFYSATSTASETHFYGYQFDEPQEFSHLGYTIGFPREEWGWLINPSVEVQDASGGWAAVQGISVLPTPPDGTSKYLQPGLVSYGISFPTVTTKAIRLVAESGGHAVDQPPTFGTTLTELSVH